LTQGDLGVFAAVLEAAECLSHLESKAWLMQARM